MDIAYVLNQKVTPESEHGSRFAGHPKVIGSPIAPSSQSSSPGATFGRTPLPDVRPPSSTGSMSSPDVPLSGLDHLAMAVSMSNPSPEHPAQRGSSPVKAKKVTRTYIEEVLAQRGEPMTSREICKVIIAVLKVELAPQSVRKELSSCTLLFEPLRNSKWALKIWGHPDHEKMPRRFGTGGGTKEARRRRAARNNL